MTSRGDMTPAQPFPILRTVLFVSRSPFCSTLLTHESEMFAVHHNYKTRKRHVKYAQACQEAIHSFFFGK